MIVLCLEGCHGCGKSTLCGEFENRGFRILKEAFLDMPDYALHPQTLLMETTWVCSWFERVLKIASANKASCGETQPILIADRSPFSAVFYANHGQLLEPLIRQHLLELRENAGIDIYTVHVTVERELLWSRIQHRLQMEPGRVLYKEHQKQWMQTTLDFYDGFEWDMTVHNNSNSIEDVLNQIVEKVSERDLTFKLSYTRRHSTSLSSIDITTDDSDSDLSSGGCLSPSQNIIRIVEGMESSFLLD